MHQETQIIHTEMNALNLISRQADELMKSKIVREMLNECQTEQEKKEKLLIATLYSIVKANN